MQIKVDSNLCQGHTLCAMAAPQVFRLSDEDGHSAVIAKTVAPEHQAAAREAARSCPEQAIAVESSRVVYDGPV